MLLPQWRKSEREKENESEKGRIEKERKSKEMVRLEGQEGRRVRGIERKREIGFFKAQLYEA
jgi:hypothetical protein